LPIPLFPPVTTMDLSASSMRASISIGAAAGQASPPLA
jgi:hypothetical protein